MDHKAHLFQTGGLGRVAPLVDGLMVKGIRNQGSRS